MLVSDTQQNESAICCYGLAAQSCLSLCNPKNCSPPCSFAHVISQAWILKWVAFSFSGVSSRPRDRTHIFHTGRRILNHWATVEAWISRAYTYIHTCWASSPSGHRSALGRAPWATQRLSLVSDLLYPSYQIGTDTYALLISWETLYSQEELNKNIVWG